MSFDRNPSVSDAGHVGDSLISVVVPLYNEAGALRALYDGVIAALEPCGGQMELVFVNDGSTDASAGILDRLAAKDPRVHVLHLSRNFGHQSALQAGLAAAHGDAVIVMDADLQDDPTALPGFVRLWREGYDVVYAVRVNRKEGLIKRAMFYAFYRLLNAVSSTPVPNDAGNFGLIDRRVLDNLLDLPEYDRFFPGLRRWVGFHQVGLPVERAARHDARPRVSLAGLFRLAKTALFSFSSVPLAMFYGISAVSLAVCMFFATFALYHKLVTGLAIPGWTSIVVVAAFFGALNALGIGILGEYVVRVYDQVRGRPKYIIARRTNHEVSRPVPMRASSDQKDRAPAGNRTTQPVRREPMPVVFPVGDVGGMPTVNS
jgi:dolichol-phosphate mannosyltransferase